MIEKVFKIRYEDIINKKSVMNWEDVSTAGFVGMTAGKIAVSFFSALLGAPITGGGSIVIWGTYFIVGGASYLGFKQLYYDKKYEKELRNASYICDLFVILKYKRIILVISSFIPLVQVRSHTISTTCIYLCLSKITLLGVVKKISFNRDTNCPERIYEK